MLLAAAVVAKNLAVLREMPLHATAGERLGLEESVVVARTAAVETAGLVVDLQMVPVVVGAPPIHRLRISLTSVVRTLTKDMQ